MTDGPLEQKSLGEVLKEQLMLVTFLVLYAGLVATDCYYATLSISYQFLSLPASHLVYRAITALLDAPALLLVYGLAISWLILDDRFSRTSAAFRRWRALLAYLLISLFLAAALPLARRGGIRAAQRDLHDGTSTLPRVHVVTTEGEDLKPD